MHIEEQNRISVRVNMVKINAYCNAHAKQNVQANVNRRLDAGIVAHNDALLRSLPWLRGSISRQPDHTF